MALGASQEIEISDAEYRMFCELVKGRCGLHFDESSRFLVEKRLARLVSENDLGNFAAYHYLLRNGSGGDDAFATLIDRLTTNETYFFREDGQLSALIDEIIPELVDRRQCAGSSGPVSIWSAGCSSGEEAYSIIMMAKEAGLEPGKDLRVYASDISRAMLTKSRRGVYREASFRETSDEMRERYFEKKDGQDQICDEVKRSVDFIHLNLMDRDRIALLGSMDVILCRNVIIYFDLETKKRVIETFYEKLRPGGYLLLGHAESLINISSAFALEHLKKDLVYRRPAPGEAIEDPWNSIAGAVAARLDPQGGPGDVS